MRGFDLLNLQRDTRRAAAVRRNEAVPLGSIVHTEVVVRVPRPRLCVGVPWTPSRFARPRRAVDVAPSKFQTAVRSIAGRLYIYGERSGGSERGRRNGEDESARGVRMSTRRKAASARHRSPGNSGQRLPS